MILTIQQKVVTIWISFSCPLLFTFQRFILLSFWVTGSQLSQCFAVFFLSKFKQNPDLQFWAEKIQISTPFCWMIRIVLQLFYYKTPLKLKLESSENRNAPSEFFWTHFARIIVARQHWHPVLWPMFIKVRKFIIFSSLTPRANILKMNYHCNEKLIIRKDKIQGWKIVISTEFLFLSLWFQKNKGNW